MPGRQWRKDWPPSGDDWPPLVYPSRPTRIGTEYRLPVDSREAAKLQAALADGWPDGNPTVQLLAALVLSRKGPAAAIAFVGRLRELVDDPPPAGWSPQEDW